MPWGNGSPLAGSLCPRKAVVETAETIGSYGWPGSLSFRRNPTGKIENTSTGRAARFLRKPESDHGREARRSDPVEDIQPVNALAIAQQ